KQYVQSVEEFRHTQPTDSQGTPLAQEQVERLWLDNCSGTLKGSAYELLRKAYHNRQSGLQGSSSGTKEMD
ncbi:hypothetical protein HAX54_006286, partial [Datura stramonium]|nr:hypothetical protein [Datura stramonium]